MAIGAGKHLVKVAGHQLGRSSKGTPHVSVRFEDADGSHITWYGYLSDAALERTVASLKVLGWNPAEHDGRIDRLNGTDLLHGNEAEIVVENEDYDGRSIAKVKWVNEVGGGMGEAMAAEDAVMFAASLRQKILSAQPPKPSARPGPARQPVGAAAGDPDDDLPFAPLRLTSPLTPFGW